MSQRLLSIVTPAYKEVENLGLLYEQLCQALSALDIDWEWVIVDDHSPDATYAVIAELAGKDARVRGMRLARNFGSHVAISCGLQQAKGDCAVVMAADLQDPPQVIAELLAKWGEGAQVVWAARAQKEGEKAVALGFSRFYYWMMRHLVGMKGMPAGGADFFLVDRRVIQIFKQFSESNVSILALITWMGFRQETVYYTKQPRIHGSSGWNLEKKLKLTIDSVTSFTYFPIRMMSYAGFGIACVGFLYALVVIVNTLMNKPPQGWASLMVVVLVVGGVQMLMMGILGEYLWRTLDESRRRPRYWLEAETMLEEKEN